MESILIGPVVVTVATLKPVVSFGPRRLLLFGLIDVGVTAIFLLELGIGAVRIPIADIIRVLLGDSAGETTAKIVLELRLPRALAAALGGAALGVAGLHLQSIFRNPLAEPWSLAKRLSVVLTEKVDSALLTAYEVVSLGRYPYTNWSGTLMATDHTIISRAFHRAGATDLAHRTLHELSDGERQRVMTARALAQEPQVMILDEITAFLDLPRRVEIMHLLRRMAHETNRAILLSSHDLDLALRTADLIWLLPKGGKLVAGSPEDLVLDGSFERAFQSERIVFDPLCSRVLPGTGRPF